MQVSVWEKETFFAPQDVIIIGSGFVGLWSAYYLKKNHPRLKITVLDQGLIPTGASTRNAGFACFGSLGEVVADGKLMGTEQMLELVEMRYKGLERIRKHFKDAMVDFDLCGGYELYGSASGIKKEELQYNIDYINTLFRHFTGTKKTYRLADESIGRFGFGNTKHLVKNNFEGYLHSGKLVSALLQKVQGMGVQIFPSIEVVSFQNETASIRIMTNRQHSFSSSKILICTNAFAKNLLPEIDVVPARGQVLLTSNVKDLSFEGSFHADEGYYYFRNLGNRVLLGGARNKAFAEEATTAMETSERIQDELEKYLQDVVLPQHQGQYTIENRWAGIMAMGSEKMPIVKQVSENTWCAVRMSGMGVALAPIVGQQVARMMED